MDLFNIEEEHIVFNKSIENLINSHKQVVGKLLERIDYLHNQNKELLLKNKELAEENKRLQSFKTTVVESLEKEKKNENSNSKKNFPFRNDTPISGRRVKENDDISEVSESFDEGSNVDHNESFGFGGRKMEKKKEKEKNGERNYENKEKCEIKPEHRNTHNPYSSNNSSLYNVYEGSYQKQVNMNQNQTQQKQKQSFSKNQNGVSGLNENYLQNSNQSKSVTSSILNRSIDSNLLLMRKTMLEYMKKSYTLEEYNNILSIMNQFNNSKNLLGGNSYTKEIYLNKIKTILERIDPSIVNKFIQIFS